MEIPREWAITRRDIAVGMVLFVLTSVIPCFGVVFGRERLKEVREPGTLLYSFCHYDGNHYRSISDKGYSYHPALKSEVAFFPAYPLLGGFVRYLTKLSTEWSLLLVTYICLLGCFVVFHAYARECRPDDATGFASYACVAFGLYPVTCFFRFAYSESLFFLLIATALLGMARRWPLWSIAFVMGLTTASRPVGIALLPAFAFHLWQRSESFKQFAARLAIYGPIACWGLIAYMSYLDWEFNEPLGFATTQEQWRVCPRVTMEEKIEKLLTLEPLRWVYSTRGLPGFVNENGLFSLPLANPIFFVGTGLIVLWGTCRKQIGACDALLAAGLMAIPYVTRGYDNGMLSMARFMAVIPAVYLVLAGWLSKMPPGIAAAFLAVSAFLQAIYAAEFAVWAHVF